MFPWCLTNFQGSYFSKLPYATNYTFQKNYVNHSHPGINLSFLLKLSEMHGEPMLLVGLGIS